MRDAEENTDAPGWIVKLAWLLFFLALLAVFANVALSQYRHSLVYEGKSLGGGTLTLRLADTPCASERVLQYLRAQVSEKLVARFMASRLTWEGREWISCWILVGGSVYSIDEAGDLLNPPYGVPYALFVKEGE